MGRILPFISKLIGPFQSLFIPGRSIADNVLVAQDLLNGFHLEKGVQRMCLKLYLAKAYDSLRWDFY